MKTALDLVNEITAYGFDQRKTLVYIDKLLDKAFGIGCRKPLSDEELSNLLYGEILGIFAGKSTADITEIEKEAMEYAMELTDRKRGRK